MTLPTAYASLSNHHYFFGAKLLLLLFTTFSLLGTVQHWEPILYQPQLQRCPQNVHADCQEQNVQHWK